MIPFNRICWTAGTAVAINGKCIRQMAARAIGGQNDIRLHYVLHLRPVRRPVSESESGRQRARNGASESERDFFRKRATIHTSESKRAKFRMGREFFALLCYNGVAMSVASTEHITTQSQSGFHCFSTSTQQIWVVSRLPAVSAYSRLVLLLLLGIIGLLA